MSGLTMIDIGRATLTAAVQSHNVCLALGFGSAAWTSPPPDPASGDTALVSPTCMVRPTQKAFVTQAAGATGAIQMSDGTTWNISATKTRFLFCQYVLQFAEGPTDQYRELGLYLDPVFDASVAAGQNYIPWVKVTNAGDLLALERFNMIDRAGVKETIGRLMTF